MKVIPLSEAKANLSHYGRLCHDEPIIVTVNGVPSFQLVPLSEEDDLIDSLLQHNPKFRQTLKSRLKEEICFGQRIPQAALSVRYEGRGQRS